MMNLHLGRYLLGALLVSLAGVTQASDGPTSFTATVNTQSISATEQLGIIRITANNKTQTCSIRGLITSAPDAYPITLTHTVVCQNGSFTTSDLAYPGYPDPQNPCVIPVTETINVVSGNRRYANVTGTATAIGTLNICDGQNSFTIGDGQLIGY